jgi:hypothetical protein
MNDALLLTFGTPFGRWADAAGTFLGTQPDRQLLDPAIARWHDKTVGAPKLAINGVDLLGALQRLRIEPPMVGALRTLRPAGAALWGGADARLCWTAQALADELPSARFLVWVESPSQSLAHWLASEGDADPARALAVLESAADSVVRLLHLHPSKCLVVRTEEAGRHPEVLARRIAEWLGFELRAATLPAVVAPEPLCLLLAERLVACQDRLQRHYEWLYASCIPLTEDAGQLPPIDGDPSTALGAYRLLARRAAHDTKATQELFEVRQQVEQLTRRRQEAEARRDAALKERDSWRADAAEQARDGDLLLEQLHRVQEEMDAQFVREREVAAEHRRELECVRGAHDRAVAERDAALCELVEIRRVCESSRCAVETARAAADEGAVRAEAALASLQEAREALRTSKNAQDADRMGLAATRAECAELRSEVQRHALDNELLLVQLHEVQEELERFYHRHRELQESAVRLPARLAATRIEVDRFEIQAERDTAPHRELALALHGVTAADRSLPLIEARLVEHHGRPGLAFFDAGGPTKPLMAWRLSGTEAGREFVLLVPSDAPSRREIQRLGTADWHFLEAIAARVACEIERALPEASRWRLVADRLLQQLIDLPPRFRFDRIDATPDAGAPGMIRISFRNVSFGMRQAADVSLRWSPGPGSRHPTVELLEAERSPLLACWPLDDAGVPLSVWRLPLHGAPASGLGRAWRSMPRADRDLLLAMLDALPAATLRPAGDVGVATRDAAVLQSQATLPLQRALRLVHGSRLRRIARAIRGRIGSDAGAVS